MQYFLRPKNYRFFAHTAVHWLYLLFPSIFRRYISKLRRFDASQFLAVILAVLLGPGAAVAETQVQPSIELAGAPKQVGNLLTEQLAVHKESCELQKGREALIRKRINQKTDQFMRALGYYQARWQVVFIREPPCWRLQITMTPGDQVIIASVDLRLQGAAQHDPAFVRLLENPPLQVGETLSHEAYESLKRRIRDLAQQRGYPEGRFSTHQLVVRPSTNRAAITLVYDSGPRYRFGVIDFEQKLLDTAFLNGFIPFANTAFFDIDLLNQLQQRLLNSGYFKRVSIAPLAPDPETLTLPIQVQTTLAAKYRTSIGIGIATDTGPRGSLDFTNTRANTRGHRYQAALQLSSVKSSVAFSYDIPLADPVKEQAQIELGWSKLDTDSAASETWSFGVSTTTALNARWLQTLRLLYQTERFDIADEEKTSQIVVPGIGWRASRSNHAVYPTSGWRLQANIRGAAEALASDQSFLQLHGSAKYIRALGEGRILTRLETGATITNQFEDLAATFRFFAGGDTSVRGYDYQELGPRNRDDKVIGGQHLLTGSLEYDYPVHRKFHLAAFYDAGNAFNNEDFSVKHSVGLGVRWRSPLGPIRLDFAVPLDDSHAFRIHLSMGPDL